VWRVPHAGSLACRYCWFPTQCSVRYMHQMAGAYCLCEEHSALKGELTWLFPVCRKVRLLNIALMSFSVLSGLQIRDYIVQVEIIS
jgi:hypothetical protein